MPLKKNIFDLPYYERLLKEGGFTLINAQALIDELKTRPKSLMISIGFGAVEITDNDFFEEMNDGSLQLVLNYDGGLKYRFDFPKGTLFEIEEE